MKLFHTIATALFLGFLLAGTPALAQYPGNVNTDRNQPSADRNDSRYRSRPQTQSSRVETARGRTTSQSQSYPTCPPSGTAGRTRVQQPRRYPIPYPPQRYPEQQRDNRDRGHDCDRQCACDRHDGRDDDRRYGDNKSKCGVPGCQHPGNHYGLHKNKGGGKRKGC